MLRSETTAHRRYAVSNVRDRLRFTQFDEDLETDRTVLFAASTKVLELYLYGVFGDDIRDDLDLPFLELPWQVEDVAAGYTLGEMNGAYRTLRRGGVPLAAAPDPTLSLLALVPLSHFLGFTPDALKASFLSEHGAPLLTGGAYSAGAAGHISPPGRSD